MSDLLLRIAVVGVAHTCTCAPAICLPTRLLFYLSVYLQVGIGGHMHPNTDRVINERWVHGIYEKKQTSGGAKNGIFF